MLIFRAVHKNRTMTFQPRMWRMQDWESIQCGCKVWNLRTWVFSRQWSPQPFSEALGHLMTCGNPHAQLPVPKQQPQQPSNTGFFGQRCEKRHSQRPPDREDIVGRTNPNPEKAKAISIWIPTEKLCKWEMTCTLSNSFRFVKLWQVWKHCTWHRKHTSFQLLSIYLQYHKQGRSPPRLWAILRSGKQKLIASHVWTLLLHSFLGCEKLVALSRPCLFPSLILCLWDLQLALWSLQA